MYVARCHLTNTPTENERETHERRPYFKPKYKRDHEFIDAWAATLYQQDVHAMVVLPWKTHEAMTDLSGQLSDFNRQRNSLLTWATRKRLGYIDYVWANDRPDETVCVADPDEHGVVDTFDVTLDACVDVWLAPVRAGLCKTPEDFAGFAILPKHWGEEREIARPDIFGERSFLPKSVTYTPMPPQGRDDLTLEQKKAYAEAKLAEALPAAQAEGRKAKKGKKPKKRQQKQRKGNNFRGDARAVKEAHAEYALWLEFYEECRDTFRTDQTVVFPAGTVRFRSLGAICDPNPITRCL
jgi:hypothetical protein